MTHMLSGLAGGRVVVALEVCDIISPPLLQLLTTTPSQGGYNLDSISNSALAVTRVLLGQAPDELPPLVASEEATETVWLVAKQQSKYWSSIDAAACEPREGKANLFQALKNVVVPDKFPRGRRYQLFYTWYA